MNTPNRKAAWLDSEYSRTNGSILRIVKKLDRLNSTQKRYRDQTARIAAEAAALELDLSKARERAKSLARLLDLHEAGIPVSEAYTVVPHRRPRLLGNGGLTRAIYRAFDQDLTRVLTIVELLDLIVADTGISEDQRHLLRKRLVVRVNIMGRDGKMQALDPALWPGRRWRLSPTLSLKKPSNEPYGKPNRGVPGVRSANWLIQAQRTVASSALAAKEPTLAMEETANFLAKTWAEHPLTFELDMERIVSSPTRRNVRIREVLVERLEQLGDWAPIERILFHDQQLKYKEIVVSERETRRLLRQLVLEGRVEHRRVSRSLPMEWRVASTSR